MLKSQGSRKPGDGSKEAAEHDCRLGRHPWPILGPRWILLQRGDREESVGARKVRILMARFGSGYEQALPKLTRAFSEAGFEVIYLDLDDPEAIVTAALQESVDHIGITTLPGTRVEQFAEVFERLKKEGIEEVEITAGGFLDEDSIQRIKDLGVREFFRKEATYNDLIQWAREHIQPLVSQS
jgi:methylmalonyl-CoA mutase C-terminal domain/subunit